MIANRVQQTKEVRTALPTAPGRRALTANTSATGRRICSWFIAPLAGWRHVKITDRRTKKDFAELLREIADVHFPGKKIVPAMDNLNTHKLSSLYHAFPPAEAGRLRKRFEVHHTPKHGSWLNIAESGISVLNRQCLSRRIADRETLCREVAAWQDARNADPAPVKQRFTAEDARTELHSRRSLASTNIIESMNSTVRQVCRNVKRWRNAGMALRQPAADMTAAGKGFRRIKAYRQLPVLKQALIEHRQKNRLDRLKDAA